MVKPHLSLSLGLALAISCGGRSAPPASAPEGSKAEAERGAVETDAPTANAKRGSDNAGVIPIDDPAHDSNRGHSHDHDGDYEEGSRPILKLRLPASESFLTARLPEKRPGRYSAWREQSRIHVGKSHLQFTALSDGGRLILAQSQDEGSVRVYDRSSKRLITKHDFVAERWESGALLSCDPLPGSSPMATPYFAKVSPAGIDLFEVRTGQRVSHLADEAARQLILSPDKSILITQTGGPQERSTLSFYLRDSNTSVKPLGSLLMEERVDGIDLSRDNRLLAVSYHPSETMVVIDLHSGAEVARVPTPRYGGSVAFSPDGRWVAVAGRGLLLVDLLNPERRAFYSYYFNNIAKVAFSPSGDALATSSFDGHIRIFHHDETGPRLTLVQTLRHEGRTNVYDIQFDEQGNSLVSGSGDQTLRVFGAPYRPTSRSPEHDEFRTLREWREVVPKEAIAPKEPFPVSLRNGHFRSSLLDQAPRPSRIPPGIYACRITQMYKLRGCKVTKTPEGHTLLEFEQDNLLGLFGVLYDDGPVVRYEAAQTVPSTVVGCDGCEKQPLHAVFRGTGRNFTGLLTFRDYYDPFTPPPLPEPNIKFEEAEDRFPLTLNFIRPLAPTESSGAESSRDAAN